MKKVGYKLLRRRICEWICLSLLFSFGACDMGINSSQQEKESGSSEHSYEEEYSSEKDSEDGEENDWQSGLENELYIPFVSPTEIISVNRENDLQVFSKGYASDYTPTITYLTAYAGVNSVAKYVGKVSNYNYGGYVYLNMPDEAATALASGILFNDNLVCTMKILVEFELAGYGYYQLLDTHSGARLFQGSCLTPDGLTLGDWTEVSFTSAQFKTNMTEGNPPLRTVEDIKKRLTGQTWFFYTSNLSMMNGYYNTDIKIIYYIDSIVWEMPD